MKNILIITILFCASIPFKLHAQTQTEVDEKKTTTGLNQYDNTRFKNKSSMQITVVSPMRKVYIKDQIGVKATSKESQILRKEEENDYLINEPK